MGSKTHGLGTRPKTLTFIMQVAVPLIIYAGRTRRGARSIGVVGVGDFL